MKQNGSATWPVDAKNQPLPTQKDPITGYDFCRACWDGDHKRTGCTIVGCQCGCYKGRNKGLSKPHAPSKECDTQTSYLESVDYFTV